jgi:hypothetical protein
MAGSKSGDGCTPTTISGSSCRRDAIVGAVGLLAGLIVGMVVSYDSRRSTSAFAELTQRAETAYRELRDCMTLSAYSAAAMMARKILMNVAVSKGAAGNRKFVEYVDYLVRTVVSPSGLPWVERIKELGNEAAHELPSVSRESAVEVCLFVEMALRLAYEYPARAAGA